MKRQRIAPGVYDDAGTMHLVLDELLEASGWPATPENLHQMEATVREYFDGLGVPVEVDP
jgi:hypothetical protein